eukprot:10168075-Alexandrium_andersonii.AAC.1
MQPPFPAGPPVDHSRTEAAQQQVPVRLVEEWHGKHGEQFPVHLGQGAEAGRARRGGEGLHLERGLQRE